MRRWCARTTEERRDSHGLTERTGQERTPSTCLVPKERGDAWHGLRQRKARRGPRVHFVCQKAVEILLLIPRKNPLYTKASLSSIPPRSHRFLSNREKLGMDQVFVDLYCFLANKMYTRPPSSLSLA